MMKKEICRGLAMVVFAGVLIAACGSEEEGDDAEQQVMALSQFCADPAAFEDTSVRITNVEIRTYTEGTVAGCMEEDHQCCNAVQTAFVLDCDEATITLSADDEAEWEEARGEVVDPDQTWPEMDALITDMRTRMGCAGQDCFTVCTPGPPESIVAVEGTFKLQSAVDLGQDEPLRGELSVHTVELVD